MRQLTNLKTYLSKHLLEKLKNKNECRCGFPYQEKDVIIDEVPIKTLVCPKCGHTIYSTIYQVYFNNLNPIS